MSQELKPCPFCGSEARWATTMGGDDSWEIQCSNNDCCLVVFSGNTGEETCTAWNTRASERTNAALLGALKDAEHLCKWLLQSDIRQDDRERVIRENGINFAAAIVEAETTGGAATKVTA